MLALAFAIATQAKSMIMLDPAQTGAMSYDHMSSLVAGPRVRESSPNHGPGIFLLREEMFEDPIYEYALKDMYGTKIDAIARVKNGALEFWNINGRPLTSKEVDIPSPIIKDILPNTIAFRIHQPVEGNTVENPYHDFETPEIMAYRWSKYIDRWMIVPDLGVQTVDVFLPIRASYPVAELMPNVGSEVRIDGIHFAVTDDKKQQNVDRDTRLVTRTGFRQYRTYEYQVRLNRSKFLADHPDATYLSSATWHDEIQSTTGDSLKTYVSSDKPSTYWGAIMIKRKLTLHAYAANIPTRPRGEK